MAGTIFKEVFTRKTVGDKTVVSGIKLITGPELIKSELEFLLTTPKHTLFFGNSLGLDLERYLHLLNTTATLNLIKDEIEELFIKYRKVYLLRIEMDFDNANNALNIDLVVSRDPSGRDMIRVPIRLED